jgi:SPP1 gp7 family putative phage head morphogenesis protein
MKTAAGRVTDADREQAALHERERARLERLGVDAAARIGFRAQRAAQAARRAGREPWKAIRGELDRARPILTAAMVAAHLAGSRRSLVVADAKPIVLRLDPFADTPYRAAVKAVQDRLALDDEAIRELASQYDAMAGKVFASAADALERNIRERLVEATKVGEHVRGGKAAVAEAFQVAGLTPDNYFTTEAIFRTQTALAYGAGRWQADQDPAIQEVLWGYRYVTVGDDRVRAEHRGFEGVTLPKDDPFWATHWPPNGWGCRCVTISVFEPRKTVRPPAVIDVDGKEVRPSVDKGFAFNPGVVFHGPTIAAVPAKPPKIEFVPHPAARDEPRKFATVVVDVAKLDEAWSKNPSNYVSPEGANEIEGRRERFKRFLATKEPVEQSLVTIDEGSHRVLFEDGRHRFAVLRELGVEKIPVTVRREHAEAIRKKTGAARKDR